MFEITVSQKFRASHAIRATSGEYEPIHTHDWRVEMVVEGGLLSAGGCVIDFAVLQRHLRECVSAWDGKILNELGMFLDIPPSTEFLAKAIFDQMEAVLREEGVRLRRVSVWETDNCCASYYV